MLQAESVIERTPARSKRPTVLLAVYSWDMLRALFALLGALAVFGGAVDVRGQQLAVPLLAQVIAALSDAAYAASLIVVATALTRRGRWVRQAQVASLVLAIGFILASLMAQRVTDVATLLGNTVFVVADIVAVYLMFHPSIRTWYVAPGRMPRYISGAIAFWAAINAALVLYLAVGASG